jgi:hypothetical protein
VILESLYPAFILNPTDCDYATPSDMVENITEIHRSDIPQLNRNSVSAIIFEKLSLLISVVCPEMLVDGFRRERK